MPVDSKSGYYQEKFQDWALIQAVQEGERKIKEAGTLFLPKLTGQNDTEYQAYIDRGTFFNALSRTLQGLTGAIIRKPAKIEADSSLLKLLGDITLNRESIHEVIRKVIENLLGLGYYGILVDMPTQAAPGATAPYLALYPCGDILNFRTERRGNEEIIVMIALAETEKKPSAEDAFELTSTDLVRILMLDEAGKYVQQIWEKSVVQNTETWLLKEEITPIYRGLARDRIPFVFFGSTSNNPIPPKPPLLDLANLNIKHWQVSADYYHGLHYCAIPTPWAAGFKVGTELYIGAQKAWVADDPNAKAGFLEFTGQGLGAVEKALDKLEKLMAVMGARLLEEQKRAGEAAETIRLRASGDISTMTTIISAVETGITKVLEFVQGWTGGTGKILVTINRDLVSERLTPQDIQALLQALQAGKISHDTFLYNLQSGELLPPARTIQEEKDLIGAENPAESFTGLQ